MAKSKRENKREIILQAAGECFARYGFEKTTLEDIGRLIRMNKASLYYYFKNKEAMFMEVVLAETDQFIQEVEQKIQQKKGARKKVLLFLSERLRFYKNVLNLHQLSIQNLRNMEPLFEELYKMVREREIKVLQSILDEGRDSGELGSENMKKVAEGILGLADGLTPKSSAFQIPTESAYKLAESLMAHMIKLLFKGMK